VGLGGMSRAMAVASAAMAFSLNCASFLLIGNTSALTLQVISIVCRSSPGCCLNVSCFDVRQEEPAL